MRIVFVVCLVLSLAACRAAPDRPSPSDNTARQVGAAEGPPPRSLDEAISRSGRVQVVTAGSRGAYVLTDFGVWYLSVDRAFRVKESDRGAINMEESLRK